MADAVRQVLTRPIQLADSLSEVAPDPELASAAARLSSVLRQAARADLYERPARRVAHEAERALTLAFSFRSRARGRGIGLLRRLFAPDPSAGFLAARAQLDRSVGDVRWLLRISDDNDSDDDDLGLPPVASNEPHLGMIWTHVAKLIRGSQEKKADAAGWLLSIARDNERYGWLIIEEGGVPPLLRLLKEGNAEGQESAAASLVELARDAARVESMVQAGACPIFARLLKEGPMRVQALVARTVAKFAHHYPPCRDAFASQHPYNTVRLLIGHLSFETVQENSKYHVYRRPAAASGASRMTDVSTVVQTTMLARPNLSLRERIGESPAVKAEMKAMAAMALWKLAKDNPSVCRSMADSRALLCFAALLEKGPEDVRRYSAMAVMEMARVAEREPELRRLAFNPTAPAARAVVDQLVKIAEKGEHAKLLVPSVVALGCLSRTFRATETRVIGPLVRLLEGQEADVTYEAIEALIQFVKKENYLHRTHAAAVAGEEGAVAALVQLVYLGEQHRVQMQALVLLCLVAMHVPESEAMASNDVLKVLEWASKKGFVVVDGGGGGGGLEDMLVEAQQKLDLFQAPSNTGRLVMRGSFRGSFRRSIL